MNIELGNALKSKTSLSLYWNSQNLSFWSISDWECLTVVTAVVRSLNSPGVPVCLAVQFWEDLEQMGGCLGWEVSCPDYSLSLRASAPGNGVPLNPDGCDNHLSLHICENSTSELCGMSDRKRQPRALHQFMWKKIRIISLRKLPAGFL